MRNVKVFLVRLVLVAAGLIFAASLVLAMLVFAAVFVLRASWAVVTGRPVPPFVVHVDPRTGFSRVYRAGAARTPAPDSAAPASGGPAGIQDVTDVVPKEPRRQP